MRASLILPLLAAVAACAPTPEPVSVPMPLSPTLARVIGQPPETAVQLLGSPSLDRSEGTARHLQFARQGCVLDLFYYPDGTGRVRATYADARRSDGSAIDAGQCFEAMYRVQPLS